MKLEMTIKAIEDRIQEYKDNLFSKYNILTTCKICNTYSKESGNTNFFKSNNPESCCTCPLHKCWGQVSSRRNSIFARSTVWKQDTLDHIEWLEECLEKAKNKKDIYSPWRLGQVFRKTGGSYKDHYYKLNKLYDYVYLVDISSNRNERWKHIRVDRSMDNLSGVLTLEEAKELSGSAGLDEFVPVNIRIEEIGNG